VELAGKARGTYRETISNATRQRRVISIGYGLFRQDAARAIHQANLFRARSGVQFRDFRNHARAALLKGDGRHDSW
jgi:hypothetical protein